MGEIMKRNVIGITLVTVLLTGFLSSAYAAKKPVYWQPVDKKGKVHKLCDNGNLIYIYKNGYAGGFAVIEGGCK